MDDLIGQLDCGSKPDSIMMRILRSAMDKAHEKLQFKDRPIEFLHEQTMFYELLAILVEGGLKIAEEDESEVLESSRSKIISNLIEIRERLVGRIRDMKRLIIEKDREFRERLENELRLREALEVTERESVHLYEKIGPGLMKMKDSVDEQVLNIKQKLEAEKMILDSEIRARTSGGSSPNPKPAASSLDKGRGLVMLEDEKMILNTEKRARKSLSNPNLSSDFSDSERRVRRSISNPNLSSNSLDKDHRLVLLENEKMILNTERRAKRSSTSIPNLSPSSLNKERGLIMLEDGKMILNIERRARRSRVSSPNFNPDSLEDDQFMKQTLDLVFGRMQLAEALPLEKQWKKGIKREVESILIKGFVRDLHTKFDIELKKRDGLVKDSWFDFIDEMKSLFHELKDFFSRNDVSNVQPCLPKARRTNSEPNLDIDFTQNLLQNDGDNEVGGSHHVWKIIKSHESIIRRQREQRSLLTRDAPQSSWIKRNEDINAMERLIQDAIVRLENFTQRKHKVVSDLKGVGCRSRAQEKKRRIPKPRRRMDRTSTTTIQSFEAEIKKLQEERDGLCFQISVIEDTYQLLFRGVMKDFSCCGAKETASDESEGSNTDHIMMHYIESAIREDIFVLIFQEMVKQLKMSQSDLARDPKVPQEDFCCSPILQDYTECLLREDLYKIYLREMTEAWRSEALQQFDFEVATPQSRVTFQEEIDKQWKPRQEEQDCTECFLRGEIYKIYLEETTKAWRSEALKQFSFEVRSPQFRVTPQEEIPQEDYAESLLREEIYKTYLRETTKSWRSSEESRHFDFEARTPQSRRAQACQEGTPRSGTPRSRGGDGESSLIHKVDSLLKSLELEEDLMLTASSLIKEHSVSNSLVILDCEETEERDAIEWLITDDESTFCSVSEKLERALQQLHTSKELLAELEESLEVSDDGGGGGEEYYENSHFNSILRLQDETTSSYLQLQGVGETDWSENVLAIIKRFRFLVDDVEVQLHENLEGKCLRLEALKRQVDALTQPVAWIRTRKLLYEKAFISRCRNLKLAETEVDLLGDQVETLLSLLERIYLVLSRDARVLSSDFEVYEILKLIKIELNGGRSSNQNLELQNNRIKMY